MTGNSFAACVGPPKGHPWVRSAIPREYAENMSDRGTNDFATSRRPRPENPECFYVVIVTFGVLWTGSRSRVWKPVLLVR